MTVIHRLATQLLAASRYAIPIEEARAEIRARRSRLLAPEPPPAEPDFAAKEPFADPVNDATGFARDFWRRREKPQPPAEPPGRPPKLCPDSPLRVLDGGKAPDGDGDNDL